MKGLISNHSVVGDGVDGVAGELIDELTCTSEKFVRDTIPHFLHEE